MKEFLCGLLPSEAERAVLTVGGVVGWIWGIAFQSHEAAVAWFCAIMLGDYIAGVYRACYLGEYRSSKGVQGIIKKFLILSVCALSHGLDVITGFNCVQTAFLGAFGLNEMLSILENLGRIHPGFVPEQLQHFLESLKARGVRK